MSDFSNISVTQHDDKKVSLLIDGHVISEKYELQFDHTIVDELKNLEDGKSLKLFDQFIYSHIDLNFEHTYSYITYILKADEKFKTITNFVYKISAENQDPIENVITKQGQPMSIEDINEFINKQIQVSLSKYTDLNYAY